MFKKTITLAIAILVLMLTLVIFNQNIISFASTSDSARLTIYVGPESVLADNSTYNCIFVQLQDSSGQPARHCKILLSVFHLLSQILGQ